MSRNVMFGLATLLTVFVVVLIALPYIKKYLPGAVQGFQEEEEEGFEEDEEEGFKDEEEEGFEEEDDE